MARIAAAALLVGVLIGLAPSRARGDCHPQGPLSLRQRDPLLQQRLEGDLRAAGLGHALDARRLTLALVDLTRPGALHYAGIHDDRMLYAASLPKIAILLALFEAIERGDVPWRDAWRWKIQKMINHSNNAEATWAAEQVGLREIARVMRDPRYCFYESGVGGLWAGRAFQKGGPSYREPLKSLSHAATARQAARFYVLLDRGRLVSRYWSRYMRHLMAPPEYFHKFVGGLQERPGVEFVARKSGTWKTFHSDSALIRHGHARYVLVALADHPEGESMLRTLARIADDIIVAGDHRSWAARAAYRRRRP
jgi:beta-lactamase class A